jgi:hypothetical protein
VARGAVAVSVEPLVAWKQPVEGLDEVVIGPRPGLDHDEARGRVRHEHVQQPVTEPIDEPCALPREVDDAPPAAGPDRDLGRPQGKMLRRASRMRPSPPPAGVDS